jgi:two-component system, sensor histidine kinase and response regulator
MENLKDTILIVDDNPNNLKVVAGVLKEKGYDFRMAKSGKLALNILEKTKPDLILLDVQMPEMDGFETCKRIKQDESNANIPVVYLTANTDSDSIKNAFSSGGVDYVTKPFNPIELLARIKTHIQLKKQAEELELQNATKDKFFSIISHDLKNPIASIIGFSELLNEDYKDIERSKIEKFTAIINKSANFTLDLLQNLLEWSRVQTGSIKPAQSNFNLSNLINTVVESCEGQTIVKEIGITTNFSPDLSVYADIKMIETILRNLLANAIKFTPNGKSITISTEEKIIDNRKVVETIIKDTGIGISEENRLKLFKIEHNYTSLGTNKEKGTGLGLILCKEFITQNNGTIRVESEENVGSSFIFTVDSAK